MTKTLRPIDALVSVALYSEVKDGHTEAGLSKGLGSLLRDLSAGRDPKANVGESITWLSDHGFATKKRLRTEKAVRYALTDTGRKWVEAFVGIRATGRSAKPLKWSEMLSLYLVPRALGHTTGLSTDVRRSMTTADGFRAEVLRKEFVPELPPGSSLVAVKRELLWTLLTRGAAPAVVQKARSSVKRPGGGAAQQGLPGSSAILNALCFSAAGLPMFDKRENAGIEALVAERSGASNRRYEHVRQAVLIRLFTSVDRDSFEHSSLTPPATTVASSNGTDSTSASQASFRDDVLHAAQTTPTAKAGDDQVFISHVWRELRTQRPTMDLERFKVELFAAYRRGELKLTRADMPQRHDPKDLEESCIDDGGRELVFVSLPERRAHEDQSP